MRIAHLIMAHKSPAQVERLIRSLSHQQADFYIHLDKKADMRAFEHIGKIDRVRFTRNRFLVRWAAYSFLHAILESCREILEQEAAYDFINLLSAQDYPLKPNEEIIRFFEENKGYSFLSFEKFGSAWWDSAITRVECYHTTDYSFKGQYRIQSLVNRLLPKRRLPLSYTLYGGACGSWWTMSRQCIRYVVDFMDKHPQLRRFSRFTWCPDEFLISTILMNSTFRDTVVNTNLRYIDWSEGNPNPKLLTMRDMEKLTHSDCFFARKFDIQKDSRILDMLDKSIATRQLQSYACKID